MKKYFILILLFCFSFNMDVYSQMAESYYPCMNDNGTPNDTSDDFPIDGCLRLSLFDGRFKTVKRKNCDCIWSGDFAGSMTIEYADARTDQLVYLDIYEGLCMKFVDEISTTNDGSIQIIERATNDTILIANQDSLLRIVDFKSEDLATGQNECYKWQDIITYSNGSIDTIVHTNPICDVTTVMDTINQNDDNAFKLRYLNEDGTLFESPKLCECNISDLSIEKSASKVNWVLGDTIDFTFKVKNNGKDDEPFVTITNVLDKSLRYISSPGYNYTGDKIVIGSLAKNDSIELMLSAVVEYKETDLPLKSSGRKVEALEFNSFAFANGINKDTNYYNNLDTQLISIFCDTFAVILDNDILDNHIISGTGTVGDPYIMTGEFVAPDTLGYPAMSTITSGTAGMLSNLTGCGGGYRALDLSDARITQINGDNVSPIPLSETTGTFIGPTEIFETLSSAGYVQLINQFSIITGNTIATNGGYSYDVNGVNDDCSIYGAANLQLFCLQPFFELKTLRIEAGSVGDFLEFKFNVFPKELIP